MEVPFRALLVVDGFISGNAWAHADCSFLGRSVLPIVVAAAKAIAPRTATSGRLSATPSFVWQDISIRPFHRHSTHVTLSGLGLYKFRELARKFQHRGVLFLCKVFTGQLSNFSIHKG